MSHRIEGADKQEGIEQAWHGLTVIRPDLDLDHNWLRQWEIMAVPTFIEQDGVRTELPFQQLVASDDPRVIIGAPFADSFRPIRNSEFLGMLQEAFAGTAPQLASIGTIRSRGRRFASFKLEQLETYRAGGREFKAYLNVGDGLDKSSVLWVNTSNICVVCNNTFNMNLWSEEGQIVRQRHTRNISVRLPEISKLIDQAVGVQHEFANAFESMAAMPVNRGQARYIYAGFVTRVEQPPVSTRTMSVIDRLTDLFATGPGNRGESCADLFSGMTQYYTHEASGKSRNPLRQIESSDFGNGAERKAEFWKEVRSKEALNELERKGAMLLQ